ncbi:MAG: OsmC family protein [Oscillospiraceae bacterium]|nr:OsmC family protein [Oscillospiraceae bacterium]
MLTTFKATARKLPDGLQVETNSRGFKILIDEPKELGGTDTGMNPVEGLLCALGACQTIVASAFAAKHKIKFKEFYVELEGDLDPDGFLGRADVRKGFQEIRYTMHFVTDQPKEKIEEYVKFIEGSCPVGDCLINGVKLVLAGIKLD